MTGPLELITSWRDEATHLRERAKDWPLGSTFSADYYSRAGAYTQCADQLEATLRAQAATSERTYSLTNVNRAQWAIHMAHWHGKRGNASQEVLSALAWAHQRVIDVMKGNDPTAALPAVVAHVDAALAQASAATGEHELLTELRESLTAFDAARAEEEAAFKALMSANEHAPKNERGQFLDPAAVFEAAEPFRPRHEAAQDARLDAQTLIEGRALESARLAVKLASDRATPIPAEAVSWDAAVNRLTLTNDGLVLTARADSAHLLATLLRDAAEKLEAGTLEFHDETCGWGLWFRAAPSKETP